MSSTGMSIAILERHIQPQWSRFDALVSPVGLESKRWIQTCYLALEENPKLLNFDVEQHLRWVNSSATLGLEPGGPLGLLWPIPYNGVIQPIVGYKGYNTMAGRAGIIIHGDVLREGDEYEAISGSDAPVRVKLRFKDRQSAPVEGAWAQGQLPNGRFTTPVWMDLSELLVVKKRSPGGSNKRTWGDFDGPGFAAMCAKTPKRRLATRHLPALITPGLERLNISQHSLGAAMDSGHEDLGRHTYIDDKATVVHGEVIESLDESEGETKAGHLYRIERAKSEALNCADIEEWRATMIRGIVASAQFNAIRGMLDRNETVFDALFEAGHERDVQLVRDAAESKIAKLESQGGG